MASAYSIDLRKKIVDSYQQTGSSFSKIAERFNVARSTVGTYVKRFKNEKTLNPKKRETPGNPPKLHAAGAEYITILLKTTPDLSLAEMCQQFEAKFRYSLSIASMSRGLDKHRVTRKKKLFKTPKN